MEIIKQFLLEHGITLFGYLISGGSLYGYFFERNKNKALTSQEISKADQDKITTAEKTIELVDKLAEKMTKQYDELSKEIVSLKKKLTDVSIELDEEKGK